MEPSNNQPRRATALLLGMVYSTEVIPKCGQEYRDRVRCDALEKHYEVYTLDDKHDSKDINECKMGRHCTANFCDTRRMSKSIQETWGNSIQFDVIVLDYFFSPVIIIIFLF